MSRHILRLLAWIFRIFILCSNCIYCVQGGKFDMQGKIVGGSSAKICDFPHAVYLAITCGDIYALCGSSIVNQIILVTAAHCLKFDMVCTINAQAGSSDIHEPLAVRRATKLHPHSRFSEHTLQNDIGLILLSKNLPLGNNIKRVIIKTKFSNKGTAYVAGWGITDDNTRTKPDRLKQVKVTLRPQEDCSVVGGMYEGMFCAGTTDSTKNRPSKGDSGSGLITSQHQQIGIVSFRHEPHIAMVVYTNVSYYYKWIQKEAKKLYCSKKNKQ